MSEPGFLPYHEPAVSTLLIYASFILALNLANHALDRLLFCGLIGQILVGVAWGAPGAQWLYLDAQEAILQLGYLGLILLVYEGESAAVLRPVSRHIS